MQAIAEEIFCPPAYQPTLIVYAPAPICHPHPVYSQDGLREGMIDEQLRIEREREQYEYRKGRQDGRRVYYGE